MSIKTYVSNLPRKGSMMTDSFTPVDMPQRRNAEIGPVTEGHNSHLRGFAFFLYRGQERIDPAELGTRAWQDTLQNLKELAEPEEWTGEGDGRPNAILGDYLMQTHRRLVMEDKISVAEDGQHAAFNTGLLTHFAEEIFALFSRAASVVPVVDPFQPHPTRGRQTATLLTSPATSAVPDSHTRIAEPTRRVDGARFSPSDRPTRSVPPAGVGVDA